MLSPQLFSELRANSTNTVKKLTRNSVLRVFAVETLYISRTESVESGLLSYEKIVELCI